jgi:predicted methyltransferase
MGVHSEATMMMMTQLIHQKPGVAEVFSHGFFHQLDPFGESTGDTFFLQPRTFQGT